jgi:hypothetical protein
MKDSKLIKVLKTFSPEEIKSFEKFITSPYFNSVKNYVQFFKELKKYYPDFDDDNLKNESIYRKLYKGKPFNKQVMWNLTSGFEKMVQEFLVQVSLNRSNRDKFLLILQELEKRDLDKHYLKEMEAIGKLLKKSEIDVTQFYYLWRIEESKITYWHKVKGLQNAFADNMFKASELLMLDFLSKSFRQMANLIFYKSRYNIEEQNSIFPEFIKYTNFEKITEQCRKSNSENAGLIEFYCNIIMCVIDNEKNENFFKVKEFFLAKQQFFEIREKRNILSVLTNYCLDKARHGEVYYRGILFELNEFGLEQGIATYENGRINKTLYTQIVINGLTLSKTEWVIRFIKEYTPRLVKEHQKSMKALAEGFVDFKLNKFDKVMENLNKVDFIDYRDKIHVKILAARTYYELGEFNLLLSHIDSSKHFLKNCENLSPFYKENYSKFYSYLYKLALMKEKSNKVDLNLLINNISNEKTVGHKNWLLVKAKELV